MKNKKVDMSSFEDRFTKLGKEKVGETIFQAIIKNASSRDRLDLLELFVQALTLEVLRLEKEKRHYYDQSISLMDKYEVLNKKYVALLRKSKKTIPASRSKNKA